MSRGWSVLANPVTLLLLATCLSEQEQGYYFTFFSIYGLSVFLELGVGAVIMQFAAHEMASLSWTESGTLCGDPISKARLASLLKSSTYYLAIIGLLIIICVLPAGACFLTSFSTEQTAVVAWQTPWALFVVLSACSCALSACFSILMGCGLIVEIERWTLLIRVAGTAILWGALGGGAKLYAVVVMIGVELVVRLVWMCFFRRAVLVDLWSYQSGDNSIKWWTEIWPLQWRVATSWVSRFLFMQSPTPILFAIESPAVAGRMGMSLNIAFGILNTCGAWVSTKGPVMGGLCAKRRYVELNHLFFAAVFKSLAFVALMATAFSIMVLLSPFILPSISTRVLTPGLFTVLMGATVLEHVYKSQALYLRAHKADPFVSLSVSCAAAFAVTALLFGRSLSVSAIVWTYFSCIFVFHSIGGTWIFMRKRRLWHKVQTPPGDPPTAVDSRKPQETTEAVRYLKLSEKYMRYRRAS